MTTEQPQHNDVWAAGECYEPYMGRWSRLIAWEFLKWLALPTGKDWLDVGCGTGALSEAILTHTSPRCVQGIDSSPGFVAYAKRRFTDRPVSVEIGQAQSLPIDTAAFDVAVAGLMLNFVPQASQAVGEMARVVRPDGIVAVYVWDYAGKMEMIRHFWEAAMALDPAAHDLDEGRRFPICQPAALTDLFVQAGLQDVVVQPIEISTDFVDFADYWTPFLGGQGPAPSYAVSLAEVQRSALRERIRATLPTAADGSIRLVARAWAARGRRC